MRHFFYMDVFFAAVVLKDVCEFGLFFWVFGRGHVLWHKSGGIFFAAYVAGGQRIGENVQKFFEKSCRKIWLVGNFGSTFATANGERRFPPRKKPHGDLAEREKVATFARPTLEVGGEDIEMMLQTI